jgi:transcriptional repressor NrdR
MVIKKDGRREAYDRKKISSGLVKACEKRPVGMEKIEEIVENIERQIMRKFDKEVSAGQIGELVMEKLAKLDEIAYVRFASVYRQFKDVSQFMKELKDILNKEN